MAQWNSIEDETGMTYVITAPHFAFENGHAAGPSKYNWFDFSNLAFVKKSYETKIYRNIIPNPKNIEIQ